MDILDELTSVTPHLNAEHPRLPALERTRSILSIDTMIKVLIADDHPLIREGLKHVVAKSGNIQVVAEADNAAAAIATCANGDVDVLLLDITMPGPGYAEVIK